MIEERGPKVTLDPPITACPHCGGDQFYLRVAVSGSIRERHRFDGHSADNTGMWDSVILKQRKFAHCDDCDKRIARVVDR